MSRRQKLFVFLIGAVLFFVVFNVISYSLIEGDFASKWGSHYNQPHIDNEANYNYNDTVHVEEEEEMDGDVEPEEVIEEVEYENFVDWAADCLRKTPGNENMFVNYNYTTDPEVLQKHYNELKVIYKKNINENQYIRDSSFENYFYEWWMDKPIEFFGGTVPIFGQWTDKQRNHRFQRTHIWKVFSQIYKKLRDDVIYVAVSENANGLFLEYPADDDHVPYIRKNILVFGASVGHVAVPHIYNHRKEPLKFHRFQENPKYFMSFIGSNNREIRQYMVDEGTRLGKKLNFTFLFTKDRTGKKYKKLHADSRVGLAPRGFGRTSFRLFEIMSLGSLPYYIFEDNDLPWIPYKGTSADFRNFGWISDRSGITDTITSLATEYNQEEFKERFDKMEGFIESHYTQDAVLNQIEKLFRLNGSDLVCVKYPRVVGVLHKLPNKFEYDGNRTNTVEEDYL